MLPGPIEATPQPVKVVSLLYHAAKCLEPKNNVIWQLGYEAAASGEKKEWCTQYGRNCENGWDAYWEVAGDD